MINIKFNIQNPFIKEDFKNLFNRSFQLSKNKYFEFEVIYHSVNLVDLGFSWTTKRDHAGLDLTLGLICYSVSFRTFDRRHWDYRSDKWEGT